MVRTAETTGSTRQLPRDVRRVSLTSCPLSLLNWIFGNSRATLKIPMSSLRRRPTFSRFAFVFFLAFTSASAATRKSALSVNTKFCRMWTPEQQVKHPESPIAFLQPHKIVPSSRPDRLPKSSSASPWPSAPARGPATELSRREDHHRGPNSVSWHPAVAQFESAFNFQRQ